MRYFDELTQLEVNTNDRPALLHLMANHQPGRNPAALLKVVDAYLRLNPLDEEVMEARERLDGGGLSAPDTTGERPGGAGSSRGAAPRVPGPLGPRGGPGADPIRASRRGRRC